MLKRDTFFAPELEIFEAVQKWHMRNANGDLDTVLSMVRLPLFGISELIRVVKPSGIVPWNRVLDLIEEQQYLQENIQRQNELGMSVAL